MKHFTLILFLSALLILNSCNPKISTSLNSSYPPLDYKQDVMVFGISDPVPDSSILIGQVKIGDTGFSSNCGYDIVIEKAKIEARKAGGNAIKIVEHAPPSMGSSCHRIKANILKVENIEEYMPKAGEKVLSDVDYAILNVYRFSGPGALVSYDIYLGDSAICRVKSNYKTTLHLKSDGLNTLWARTEAKSEVPIDIKMGETYYLRCGITMGVLVGRPKLELIDSNTGKAEFESRKLKNK